ncbi:MAG: helix-turn-helix domain-containing protein [Micrococcales bacterium]|nr:helix-turn-helix domain-containing protein [Micrococcales bacterium]
MSPADTPGEGQGTPPPSGEFVQSLARGFDVILAFDAEHPDLTLADVARRTALTRATARRFLYTLVTLGYVRTDGRHFSLTPRVLRLGFAYLSGISLPEVAQPHLKDLSRALGESTSAAVLDGDDIVYVARIHTQRIMSVGIPIGTRFPAYATSMGRVLLAALPQAELDDYLARVDLAPLTPLTVRDTESLRRELRRVGDQRYAVVDQELETGLRAVAVPVTDTRGRVVAAINVSMRVAPDGTGSHQTDEVVAAARHTAGAIGGELAHSPSAPATTRK